MRAAFIVSEVMLGFVLLVGAGLMIRTLSKIHGIWPGFQASNSLTFEVELPGSRYRTDVDRANFVKLWEAELQAVPGVESVGSISHLPLDDYPNWYSPYRPEGITAQQSAGLLADYRASTAGYMKAMGARFIDGPHLTLSLRHMSFQFDPNASQPFETFGTVYPTMTLRDDWGTVFTDGWKAQGCYPEIKRSLGYRFQLDSISLPQSAASGSTVNVEINLRNVGWARIFSARKLVVTLTGGLISGSAGDMRLLPPQATSSTKVVVPVAIPAGTSPGVYAVYVSMPDIWPGTKDKADFAVRFANADDLAKGQQWEAASFGFKTGTMLSVY